VEWKRGLAAELPLPDRSCDRVTMSLLLHHLDAGGKRAALAEARRVLRDGGRLHIADWGKAQDPLMRAANFTLAIFDGFDGIRDHAAGRLPAFVEGAGFGPVERHDRLRTAWGSLELLSSVRAG
jgi:SAM-dependent methyltransferase